MDGNGAVVVMSLPIYSLPNFLRTLFLDQITVCKTILNEKQYAYSLQTVWYFWGSVELLGKQIGLQLLASAMRASGMRVSGMCASGMRASQWDAYQWDE